MATQVPSGPSPITSLSTELKVLILRQMPDVASLKAIVHASSQYHQVYLGMRESILTAVVRRMLDAKDLDLTIPYRYKAWDGGIQRPDRDIYHAVETVHRQARSNQPVRLNVEQCRALLTLAKAKLSYAIVRDDHIVTLQIKTDVIHCFSLVPEGLKPDPDFLGLIGPF